MSARNSALLFGAAAGAAVDGASPDTSPEVDVVDAEELTGLAVRIDTCLKALFGACLGCSTLGCIDVSFAIGFLGAAVVALSCVSLADELCAFVSSWTLSVAAESSVPSVLPLIRVELSSAADVDPTARPPPVVSASVPSDS